MPAPEGTTQSTGEFFAATWWLPPGRRTIGLTVDYSSADDRRPRPVNAMMPVQADPTVTFSVVIPCYKQAVYLKTAIDSALAQGGEVQVIVVDDGSPDDTAAVAEAFGDRVLLVRQANAGVAAARNAGLARATGAFVNFLDADDCLMPGMLAATHGEDDRAIGPGRRLRPANDRSGGPADRVVPRPGV